MDDKLFYGQGKDPLTGEAFLKRRNNQKFATRKNQIRYNNLIAQKKRNTKGPTEKILDRNRLILNWILNGQKEIVKSKDFLLGAGFQFTHYTSKIKYAESGTGQAAVIFDVKICPIENNNFKIFK